MKKILSVTLFLLVVMLVGTAHSFDSNRKGFAASLGFGFSPYVYTSNNSLDFSNNNPGVGVNLYLGYGINSKNIVCTELLAAAAVGDNYDYGRSTQSDSYTGYWGVNWYHYFKERHPSWFTVVGIGRYTTRSDEIGEGIGIVAGGGYEFIKQLQAAIYLTNGYTSHESYDYSGRSIILMLSVVMY